MEKAIINKHTVQARIETLSDNSIHFDTYTQINDATRDMYDKYQAVLYAVNKALDVDIRAYGELMNIYTKLQTKIENEYE